MDTSRIIFDCPIPPWLALAASAVVMAVVIAFVRRDVARLSRRVRWVILSLTVAALAMLTGLLLGPKLLRTWPDPQKPRCVLLVDASRSMLLSDTYTGEAARWLEERLAAEPGSPKGEAVRSRIVRTLLEDEQSEWLEALRENFTVSGWCFASELEGLSLDAQAASFEVNAEGHVTALGEALDQVASGAGGARPLLVVLISDGAWNTGRDPSEVARVLGRLGTPVFAVGVGNPSPPSDAAVLALRGPKSVLLGDEVHLTARVATTGMPATRLRVQLTNSGGLIAEKQVVTLPSGRPVNVTFSFVPLLPGRRNLTVRIPKQSDEQDESNNEVTTPVEVVERSIKVLLIESVPRWEFRFIRNVFERDPAVKLTICLTRPGVGPIKGPGYLSVVPTERKDLAVYDLIILGDVSRSSLPDVFLSEVSEMVKRRGGALAVLAGRRRRYRELLGTPIADILPVKLEGAFGVGGKGGVKFRPELTQEGAGHLITRLASNVEETELAWSRLPEMGWSAEVSGPVRGASVLLVHPYRLAGVSKLPLIAVHRVGAGKVMFSGVEETWRWRRSVGDRYHYRFWAQMVRWMVKRPFAEGDPRARLSADRTECTVGEKVEIEAYCLGLDGFPLVEAEVWLKLTHADGGFRRLVMEAAPGNWGIYRTVFTPTRPGKMKMQPIVSVYGGEPLASEATLEVTRLDLEKNFLAQDRDTLQAIGAASGGQYLHFTEADRLATALAGRVERRMLTAEYSPCRHWLYYLILTLGLGSAWLIRKRSGLA